MIWINKISSTSLKKIVVYLMIVVFGVACASSTGTSYSTDDDPNENSPINLLKLEGSPFDEFNEYVVAEEFDYETLLCGDYYTAYIDSLPIPVFAALFTELEEEEIRAGIDIFNENAGIEFYEYTDTWSDDVRVIYKVDDIYEAGAAGSNVIGFFRKDRNSYETDVFEDGVFLSDIVISDWVILIDQGFQMSRLKTIVAHELGHSVGLGHTYWNPNTDERRSLEDDSIMNSPSPMDSVAAYNDYEELIGEFLNITLLYIGDSGINLPNSDRCGNSWEPPEP